VDWVIDHPHPRPFNLGRSVPGLRPSTDRPRLKSKKKSHKMWYQLWGQVNNSIAKFLTHCGQSPLNQRGAGTKFSTRSTSRMICSFQSIGHLPAYF